MLKLPDDPMLKGAALVLASLAVFVAVLIVAVLSTAPPLAVAGLLLVGVFGGYFLYQRGKS